MWKQSTTIALLVGTVALSAASANADNNVDTAASMQLQRNFASNAVRAMLSRASSGIRTPGAKVEGSDPGGTLNTANPKRAYPPSCLATPLPEVTSGEVYTIHDFPIEGYDFTANTTKNEDVDISFWRVPCSSSGAIQPYNTDGGYNAITLMRIDRNPENEGQNIIFFPDVRIAQGSIGFDDPNFTDFVRFAEEPNTLFASFFNTLPNSKTVILENYAGASTNFQLNDAFTVRVGSFDVSSLTPVESTIDVPAYQPDQTNYPSAFAAMPIDGYATASWQSIDDALDGLFVTVSESLPDTNGNVTRQLIFTRLFADATGAPFFITGAAAFNYGDRTLTVNAGYLGAGTGSSYSISPWGTATFTFNSCNDLKISYAPNVSLPDDVPGSATTVGYRRINLANGLLCE